ncbi:MAG: glycoside hydrolase family 2 TIM barrel-domain containing protein [Terracidiphilus sp.]
MAAELSLRNVDFGYGERERLSELRLSLFDPARRQFLQAATFSAAGLMLAPSMRATACTASESATGQGMAREQIIPLDGEWEFHSGSMSGVEEAWLPGRQIEWGAVTLPHCFNALDACDSDKTYFRGQGWYRRRLVVRNPYANGRTILHFQGAGQTTTLWIGTTRVETHIGGYDEFAFDITDAVALFTAAERASGVQAVVLCDNAPDRDRIPSELSDFCLYGGLYRHVNLIYLPAVALDAAHILPVVHPGGAADVSVAARLYNTAAFNGTCEVAVEVWNPRGSTIHRMSQALPAWQGFAPLTRFRVDSPDRWSPASPNLYRCRVTLSTSAGEMQIEQRFGIRHLEFLEHGPFKLNGERVLLRGTQRHQDHAGVAAGMSDDQTREELRMIREMGANFIRLAHYQQDRLVLDLCDELGLMVWEELPWCRAGVGGHAFQQNATDMLTHMIDQHYNHPSIVFWGLGNEDDWPDEYPRMDKAAIRSFMTRMRDLAHRLDGSRMTAFRRCDFARDIPDVYSPSIWAGWYRGSYREYEQSLVEQRSRVPRFIHIEWGADSHAGRHSEDPDAVLSHIRTGEGTDERGLAYLDTGGDPRVSADGDWSETYACNLFDWHLKTQEELDWLSGSAQWIFKDFASPLRGDNGIPYVNQKGVVERDLRKKESYYIFQSYWSQTPMAHIYGHSWPIRWGKEGQLRTVHVYSNCERAELFLNGVSQGTKKRDSQNFPAAGLRWDVVFAPGPNHLRVEAHKGDTAVSDEIDLTYQTEPWGTPAALVLHEKERDGSRITVEAKLFDAHGVLCLDARHIVRFSLAGTGRLIDNLGTTRGSRELQLANGRAQISLEAIGACTVEAAVDGISVAALKVSA